MKELRIPREYDQMRIDKVCAKILPAAPKSFFYKMFRKKNIVLNGKKIQGIELVKTSDLLRFFLSDETFEKMQGRKEVALLGESLNPFAILYEDQHLLVYNKPVGVLSQPGGEGPDLVSMYEVYLKESNFPKDEFTRYGVCNRLDRNTTGVSLIGRNAKSLQWLNQGIAKGFIDKRYHVLVVGAFEEKIELMGYLYKDTLTNKVQIQEEMNSDQDKFLVEKESVAIRTEITPLKVSRDRRLSLLEIQLHTGKTHQIRAHLQSIGYPVLGDPKYGDEKINGFYRKSYDIRYQQLHSYSYTLYLDPQFPELSGKKFIAPYPNTMERLIKEFF